MQVFIIRFEGGFVLQTFLLLKKNFKCWYQSSKAKIHAEILKFHLSYYFYPIKVPNKYDPESPKNKFPLKINRNKKIKNITEK